MSNDSSKVEQYVQTPPDLTELLLSRIAHLEAERQRSKRLERVGLLSAGIAHDLSNLLTIAWGYSDLARQEVPPDSTARAHLDKAAQGIRRIAHLARQMLVYSGNAAFASQPVQLSRLVREMHDLLTFGHESLLQYQLDPQLPEIQADPVQLEQLVLNLVANATARSEEGQPLTITTGQQTCDAAFLAGCESPSPRQEGRYVFLQVADTGPGMPAEIPHPFREHLFFPVSLTPGSPGGDLGMAIVQDILTCHGGALRRESQPGRGTTVTAYFPVFGKPSLDLLSLPPTS